MGSKRHYFFAFIFFMSVFSTAQAQIADIQAQVVSVSGSGCNPSNVTVSFGASNQDVSILYDRLVSELKGLQSYSRTTCYVVVRFDMPGNVKMSVLGMDFRGFASVGAATTSTVTVQHTGSTIWQKQLSQLSFGQTIVGAKQQSLSFSSNLNAVPLTSMCASNSNRAFLQFGVNITIENKKTKIFPGDTYVQIDSADASSAYSQLRYRIATGQGSCR